MATLSRVNNDGSISNIQVRPSYAHKPKAVENLMKGLPGLVQTTSSSSTDSKAANIAAWRLDDSGDTIHRHVSLRSEATIPVILERIAAASRELDHDPHTDVDGTHLTISCTTHVPPGLCMKDVKLARKIDEILNDVSATSSEGLQLDKLPSSEQREAAEKRNMTAIKKAKEDCSCG